METSLALELFGYVFTVVLGIVPIVNPFSTAPVFMAMTAHVSSSERHRTATLACLYMCGLLIVFLLVGSLILQFFGISLKSLRLAGGLIIAYMGFRMLFPPEPDTTASSNQPEKDPRELALTPLALPMLCGPGSISVVLAMSTNVSQQEAFLNQVIGYSVVATGIILASLICWLVLWSSGAVVRFLGRTGIDATTKLMGFLLVCIGAEFVVSGWAMA